MHDAVKFPAVPGGCWHRLVSQAYTQHGGVIDAGRFDPGDLHQLATRTTKIQPGRLTPAHPGVMVSLGLPNRNLGWRGTMSALHTAVDDNNTREVLA